MANDGWQRRGGNRETFRDVVAMAIRDMEEHGFDSVERVERWVGRIRNAADAMLISESSLDASLRGMLESVYSRMVVRGGVLKFHPGVSKFTLQNIRQKLRPELDRRIMASAGLIKLNRQEAIEKTVRRFSGWATSVPDGGTDVNSFRETDADVRKSMQQLPFVARRVAIDQGHKLVASINDIIATDQNAIAFKWHSRWRQANYAYRKDHKERDDHVYAVRGSWAVERGLINKGEGYTDDMTAPGEEVFCRCYAQYLYALRELPDDMITAKGREELARIRRPVAA